MTDNPIFTTWHDAYRHIAQLLFDFNKANRDNIPAKMYDVLVDTEFAVLNQGRLFREKLSRISEWGLDPIQIFASFNYPRIGRKRVDIINALLHEFNSIRSVDDNTSFEGCPSPIITAIIQYRGWGVQSQIWKMFGEVMEGGFKGLNTEHFALLKGWRGVDIASLTMFLFWINSDEFVPLDKNTVEFLREYSIITQRPRNYREYYDLCTDIKFSQKLYTGQDVIRNIVYDAYIFAEKATEGSKYSQTSLAIINMQGEEDTSAEDVVERAQRRQQERAYGFQIIALRPKEKEGGKAGRQKHLKNLRENELYQFYHSYQFDPQNDDMIIYDADKDVDLYSQGDLKISISAIVGKNGSGKSTIAEFLYLIVNKIALKKDIGFADEIQDEEVYADLFIKLDKLYKIETRASVAIFEYNLDADNRTYRISKDKIDIGSFDIERFCYSIVINYSLYGLNTNIIGDWIYPLFHKNDSYQTPIVLNPLRNEGNINVNREEGLARARMLSNILEPDLIFEERSVRELVPNSIPVRLVLEVDEDKARRKRAQYKESYGSVLRKAKQINKVITALGLDANSTGPLEKEVKEYIYLKVVIIGDRYSKFTEFEQLPYWVSKDNDKLKNYASLLLQDTSHITFKLKQAINYLRHGLYDMPDRDILALIEEIRVVKEETGTRTIELVPPSFFKADLVFDHGGTFNLLSSGEKQQVLSINTITYHIYNIASVMEDEDSFKYRNINIVFDEVELYFHPEMQKSYISNLLDRIYSLPLQQHIDNINMLFVTHSPFILSDIPSTNVLRLATDPVTKESKPVVHAELTFGANTHDLLANDFFLQDGFIGDFAKKKINEIIRHLNIQSIWKRLEALNNEDKGVDAEREKLIAELALCKVIEETERIKGTAKKELPLPEDIEHITKQQNFIDQEPYRKIIQIVGEPLIRHKLLAMYNDIFGKIEDEEAKRLQLLKLAKELNYQVSPN